MKAKISLNFTSFVICFDGDCNLAFESHSTLLFTDKDFLPMQNPSRGFSLSLGTRKLDHLGFCRVANPEPSTIRDVLYVPFCCLVTVVSFLRKFTAIFFAFSLLLEGGNLVSARLLVSNIIMSNLAPSCS